MGTNYYLHVDVCECCNRAEEEIHIGKKSFGWVFGLQGHMDWLCNGETVNKFVEQIGAKNIKSWKDWKKIFSKIPDNWHIVDEYGKRQEKKEFIKYVESSYKVKTNKKHADYYGDEQTFKDDKGYDVSLRNFS